MRKRKKRKKKKLHRGGRALRRLQQWHIRAPRVVFPSYVGRPQLPGIIVGMDQYYSLLRARHRHWQRHFQGWFCWSFFALCSSRSSSGLGCFASWPVWTRRTLLRFWGFFTWVYSDRAVDSRPALRVAGFTGDDTSRAVFLGCLRAQDARHFGRHGPEGQLRRRGQGLRSRSPLWCSSSLPNVDMVPMARIALSLSWVWCSCSLPHVAAHQQGRIHPVVAQRFHCGM